MSNERVVCAACGSNNFATQAACWKCGRALATAPPPVPSASPPASSGGAGAIPVAARPTYSAELRQESPAAFWSSVALGIVFPMLAIPVGMVFLMLDDKRKAQIGWWNILFGLVGTLLNGILAAVTIMPLLMGATKMIPGMDRLGGGSRSQDMSSEAAPLDLPGQRPFAAPPR
ncbi:MAG: hypothetical protein NTX57_01425 [Armatimonadetes bacterium]|nr:hypothetical protein [Armatimonadota bacterium]